MPIQQKELTSMTDVLYHRGPDGEGHWISESGKVGLGHRRLAIIDLSSNGAQPMTYDQGRFVITYNGEIYNYLELREELEKRGVIFKTQTDTEVLLALYALEGAECLDRLDGMFAFAIWDNQNETLFCARDRFGEKPFFYHMDRDNLIFGSEIKALWAAGIEKVPDNKRIYNYLVFSAIEDANDRASTFYKSILQLEPAHQMTINKNGKVIKKKYWNLQLNIENLSFKKADERFYELFESSIYKRLRADVPVGSSLSGGLDSSSIVALIDKIKGKGQIQKTFSARFKNSKYDEGKYMKEIISSTNVQPHFTWPDAKIMVDEIDKIYYHQDEPFISSSIIAQWEVMKLTKENNVTVLLDGQGADEILAGYTSYFDTYFRELYLNDKERLRLEIQHFEKLHETTFNDGMSFKLRAKYPETIRKLGNFRRTYVSQSIPVLSSLNKDFLNTYKSSVSPFFKEFNNLNEALRFSTAVMGISQLLRYADRNSMAFSLEVRLPFLSHLLVEFLFSLPPDYKIFEGWTKYILRKSVQKLLPSPIAWRKDKIGYRPPEQKWLNEPKGQELIMDSVNTLKQNKLLNKPLATENWKYIMIAKLLS